MPSFPKPKFPLDYSVGAEVKALRAHKLFPGDLTRLLEIRWRDTTARAAPSFMRAWQGARAWTVGHGVTVGSTLADVELANGRPFTPSGFAFDYSATSLSWEGGRFDSPPTGISRVIVRLTRPAFGRVSDAEQLYLSGDKDLRSNDPIVQRVKPRVYSL